jgi:sulfoxide reductase heme-binding subunit YedZ
MNSYITSIIAAGLFILIAALISNMIQFEGGSNPKDPGKRKIWFWIMAILNPILFYVLSAFVLAPNPDNDQMVYDDYMSSLPIAAIVGFVVYIVLGFVLSKVFKNGKLGNWF